MRFLACALVLPLVACGDDGGGGERTSSEGSSSSSTTDASTSSTSSSSTAPADTGSSECTDCWLTARNGACKTDFDACASSAECAGSLFCIDSMCTPDGITTECTQLCCMNCMEHGTCFLVDAWMACMTAECSGLCQPQECGS